MSKAQAKEYLKASGKCRNAWHYENTTQVISLSDAAKLLEAYAREKQIACLENAADNAKVIDNYSGIRQINLNRTV